MPYPNSQTPVTQALNNLFSNRAALDTRTLIDRLSDQRLHLADLAVTYGIIPAGDQYAKDHVSDWPEHQQWKARRAMILALERGIPIWFDWVNASTTSIEVVLFGTPLGVTFRSPLGYPPYWGP